MTDEQLATHLKNFFYAAYATVNPIDLFTLPPIPEQDPYTIARACRAEFGV